MERLCKTAKTLDTIVYAFRIFVIIALVASIVSVVLIGSAQLLDLDTDILGEIDYEIELGTVRLVLSPGTDLPPYTMMYRFIIVSVMALVTSVFALIIIKYIIAILQPMSQGKPFCDVVAVNLRKLSDETL